MKLYTLLPVFILVLAVASNIEAKKKTSFAITDILDYKDFKKLLRTRANVLILFVNSPKKASLAIEAFHDAADQLKRHATIVIIDCSNHDINKLCKRCKVINDKSYYIKHYKDGVFHKDYDRSATAKSITSFLRDPTGSLPWEEDPTATDVIHLDDTVVPYGVGRAETTVMVNILPDRHRQDNTRLANVRTVRTTIVPISFQALTKFFDIGVGSYQSALVMFYATWCGHCERLKPDFAKAATELKGEATLAAMDVFKPMNAAVRHLYNITSFPTILYFDKGNYRFPYNGDHDRESIVAFMRYPRAQVEKKKDDSWPEDSDVVHLTMDNFDGVITQYEHALVAFYAPWCGHCKRLKPEFEKAATAVKKLKLKAVIAAVDVTKDPNLGTRFNVKGYPTIKYYHKGHYQYEVGHVRKQDEIIKFIKNPEAPPPPPPPETPWSEEESLVRHLNTTNFKTTLRKIKHALVMFYAPWCGHCKTTKPEFVRAADRFDGELLVGFCAVDCTTDNDVCQNYDVKGFPTFKYFSHFNKAIENYSGGRKEGDFVSFIHSKDTLQEAVKAPKSNQAAGFGPNVELVMDENFESVIKDTKPTFVMFYATWCGHCATVKPAFSRLASDFKPKNEVKIVAIDAGESPKTADFAGISTLPTFKLYKAGVEIALYEGDRSLEDMTNFIKQKQVKEEL